MSGSVSQPLLSIIMPVYNVERYLREAVDSVVAQTFTDWELILVDDGSPDGSPAICDSYCARDSRIKVLHLENGGQGRARNSGIKVAVGKYIGFVDSDDHIAPDMYGRLVAAAEAAGADMALGTYVQEYVGFSRPPHNTPAAGIYSGPQLMNWGYQDNIVQSISCDKIFRRDIVAEGYPSLRYFEDHICMLRWFAKVNRWVVVPEAVYYYRMRRSGVVNGFSIEKRMAKFDADLARMSFVQSLPQQAHTLSDAMIAAEAIRSAVGTAKSIARNVGDRREACRLISEIASRSEDYFAAARQALPAKVISRYSDMLRHPAVFRLKMRASHMFAFASRKKESRLFE